MKTILITGKAGLLAVLVLAISSCTTYGLENTNLTDTNNQDKSSTPAPEQPPAAITTTTITTQQNAPNSTVVNQTTQAPIPDATPVGAIPTPEKREEVKRIIEQHIEPSQGDNRLVVNKPTLAPQMHDFASDSIEAKVADATTQFGLNFLSNVETDAKENVIVSPLSLQNLLNMILLGSSDDSITQKELTKVLGYSNLASSVDRLTAHEGMKNVMTSILDATHLSIPSSNSTPELLNTNSNALKQAPSSLEANLQTTTRDGESALSGQLNLTLANLIMTNKDLVDLNATYEKELQKYYDVKVETFLRDGTSGDPSLPKPIHERINAWVKNTTNNQIEKLVDESDLSSQDLLMVLLNAANFKGRWLHTFNTKATTEGTFFNYGKDASTVKYMRQKAVFGYAEFGLDGDQTDAEEPSGKVKPTSDSETLLTEDAPSTERPNKDSNSSTVAQSSTPTDAQSLPTLELSKEESRRIELTGKLNCSVLMLPFSINDGQEFSMVILLPAKRDGLEALQASLNVTILNEIYRSLSEQQVQVELPKFSFEGSHDAKSILLKMGLKSVFNQADLKRMFSTIRSASQEVKVDKVVHKAKISVDEAGAEAAAASMASIVLRNFIRPPTPVFIADHPFLFVIRHNRSNMPLFMGKVNGL